MMIIIHSLASIQLIAIRLQSFWRRLLRFRRARLSYGLFEGRKPVAGVVVYKHCKSREDLMARLLDSALEMWKR